MPYKIKVRVRDADIGFFLSDMEHAAHIEVSDCSRDGWDAVQVLTLASPQFPRRLHKQFVSCAFGYAPPEKIKDVRTFFEFDSARWRGKWWILVSKVMIGPDECRAMCFLEE